jgi:hypothetical protein
MTSSSKLYMEYLVDTADRASTFSLRVEQTLGCVLPGLPLHGASLSCSYSGQRLLCRLSCRAGWVGGEAACSLGRGDWQGGLACSRPNGTVAVKQGRLHRLLACRHRRRTGCLAPPPLPGSAVSCLLERGQEECRVECAAGTVSPAGRASCERDRSGWEARWSRVLLPCRPACSASIPQVPQPAPLHCTVCR